MDAVRGGALVTNKLGRYDAMIQRPEKVRLDAPVGEMDHVRGVEDAPVTLLEYGDYECPYCGRAYPVVREIQRRMGDALRFVYKHFPLDSVHPPRRRGRGGGGRPGSLLGDARPPR
jgi:protein-disulfide isomerase